MAETVPALLRAAARRWGDKAALRACRGATTSFAELDRAADSFAKALISDGMRPGERFGIWAGNSAEWVAAAVGAQRAGGALVPMNPRLRAAEVADMIERAKLTRLATNADNAASIPAPCRVILLGGQDFLERGESTTDAALHEREAGVTGDTVSDILFTSGTTGRPKAAVFTHCRTVASGSGMTNFAGVGEDDTFCPMGSFAHHAGYKGGWVNGLVSGATVCWSDASDTESLLGVIAAMKVTVMSAPPIVWQNILDHPRRGDWDTSSLRFIATGSTTVPPPLIRRLVSDLAVRQVGTGFGMTESGGMTNFTRPGDRVEQVAFTAGRPAPDSQVRIAGPDGAPLGPGADGEILVRTPRQLIEYLDDPAATRAAIDAEGWLRTGDVGQIDEDGFLKITGRLKEMYITNGFNVYPAEVERLIEDMPGVAMCALVGIAEPRKGEVGHAFLVRAPGASVTDGEVIAWCRRNIASYKVPAGVTFVDSLPRSALGKVLRHELKALL